VKKRGVFEVNVSSVRHLTGGYCHVSLELPKGFPEPSPGQFVMIKTLLKYPLLGRPISVHDYRRGRRGACLDLLLRVTGEGTAAVASLRKGDRALIWGPQGQGFEPDLSGPQVLVAGGRGVAPLFLLARRLSEAAGRGGRKGFELYYGAASSDEIHYAGEFRDLGFKVHMATVDGSRGFKGTVTALLQAGLGVREPPPPARPGRKKRRGAEQLAIFADQDGEETEEPPEAPPEKHAAPPVFYACGPDPMLEAVHRISAAAGGKCQVSLESRMACGAGVCLGCARVLAGGDQIHVCDDGPVFDSARVFGGAK
jgi:dihydroorotate dehydrogenase electron transfer subunit